MDVPGRRLSVDTFAAVATSERLVDRSRNCPIPRCRATSPVAHRRRKERRAVECGKSTRWRGGTGAGAERPSLKLWEDILYIRLGRRARARRRRAADRCVAADVLPEGKSHRRAQALQGLSALVKHVLRDDSPSGSSYVFVNRRSNDLKLLYRHRTGSCVGKRTSTTAPRYRLRCLTIHRGSLVMNKNVGQAPTWSTLTRLVDAQ